MKLHVITLPLLLVSLLAPGMASAADPGKAGPRIKKCQDEKGRWHYGDAADAECARSKVIELDRSGIERNEIAAPLTDAQLKARAAQAEDEERHRKAAEEQHRRDEILLATYAVEADITLTRDRKIADIETQIRSSQETLKSLQNSLQRVKAQAADEQRGGKPVSPQTAKTLENNEAQIARHEAMVKKMRDEVEVLRSQFAADLERFRQLRNLQGTAPKPLPVAKP
jgi:uncharacterized protein involved in exopolysaccharide biosynthesis